MMNEQLPKIVTESVPGPKSQEVYARRMKAVSSGVGNSTQICAVEARDALIKDIDGNVFLDFAAGIGVQNAGHNDPGVIKAITEQAEKLIHPCFHITLYEPYVELAEKLIERVPGSTPKKAMFANSGAEAVENAIKLARKYTGKSGVVSLDCSFHGRTFMAMTLTSKEKPYKHGFGPFMNDTYKIPSAYCYRCEDKAADGACQQACANQLETLLNTVVPADQIAALIVEPVQGEGGFIPLPEAYLRKLQAICKANNIVFIMDEIQSGFARTGKLFACSVYDIEPDLITMSKSIAAGMPISAVVGKQEIMDSVQSGEIGGTYGGAPLACAAGLAVLSKLEDQNLAQRALDIGELITSRFSKMAEKHACIGDVRGLGAMLAVEFVKDRASKIPDPDIVKELIAKALQKGLIVISAGLYGNVLRFLPPLVTTDAQVECAMDILEEILDEMSVTEICSKVS